MINQTSQHQQRGISSSQDNCRCEACKNQQQLKHYQRTNPSNIYMHKHMKKRGVPPTKKQCFIKDLSQRSKIAPKKQENQKKMELQKPAATPLKHKLIQILKSKQTQNSSFFIDYHPVSHSQREKFPSKQAMSNVLEQQRRPPNFQDYKMNVFNKELRPKLTSIKLVQISENPENIRMRYHHHHSRSMSQASAGAQDQLRNNQFKSLQKTKY